MPVILGRNQMRRCSVSVSVTTTVSPAHAVALPEAPTAVPDTPSFDEVYAAHYADLTVQLYAYFGDRQEAQDVVQEAFVRALARWRTVATYDDPVAWVRKVAWNLAVSRWRRARTALAFLRKQRRDEAQDVAQEAFCRAWQNWAKVSAYDDPVAWVRKVAWRLAISRWRRAKTALAYVRRQREEHVPEVSPDRVALTAALATLPVAQRRAVVLHYMAGMQISEIARQEGVADGTVKSWLHRARTTLAGRLDEASERIEEVGQRV